MGPAVIRFISPGRRQLGRMRHLGFGASLRTTVYCSLPSYERVGPYDDPLSRHYYSAYSDLFHWIAVGEVLAGHLPSPHVEVVTATGRRLLRGDEYGYFDASEIVPSRDVVRVSPEGRLKIDASVPDVGALDPSELGSPHSRGSQRRPHVAMVSGMSAAYNLRAACEGARRGRRVVASSEAAGSS